MFESFFDVILSFPHVEQKLLTLPEHMSLPSVLEGECAGVCNVL